MKKQRKFLRGFIRIDIHRLCNDTGYWSMLVDGYQVSLTPERIPNGNYILALFVNNIRQPKEWSISSRPTGGKLWRNGRINWEEVFYVVGNDGRRYRHLFLDAHQIGVRGDFFKMSWRAYPRSRASKDFRQQCKEMEKELFADRSEIRAYQNILRRKRFSVIG